MGLGDVLDDGETQPGAAELPGARLVHAVEPLGEPRQVLFRDAAAGVRHGQGRPGSAVAVGARLEARLHPHLAVLGRVLDGVVHEVDEQLLETVFVSEDVRRIRIHIGADADVLPVGLVAEELQDPFRQRPGGHLLHPQAHVAHLQVGQGQQVVDEASQPFGVALDHVEELARLPGVVGRVVQQRLGVTLYGGQGRAHLMGDVGDEIGADLLQPLQFGDLVEHQHVAEQARPGVLEAGRVDREPAVVAEGRLAMERVPGGVASHHLPDQGLHLRMAQDLHRGHAEDVGVRGKVEDVPGRLVHQDHPAVGVQHHHPFRHATQDGAQLLPFRSGFPEAARQGAGQPREALLQLPQLVRAPHRKRRPGGVFAAGPPAEGHHVGHALPRLPEPRRGSQQAEGEDGPDQNERQQVHGRFGGRGAGTPEMDESEEEEGEQQVAGAQPADETISPGASHPTCSLRPLW